MEKVNNKPMIGLSWEPKLPGLSISLSSSSRAPETAPASKSVSGISAKTESSPLWKPDSELVDGLFVPPNNPRKFNKLFKKQAKDTAGSSWYVLTIYLIVTADHPSPGTT